MTEHVPADEERDIPAANLPAYETARKIRQEHKRRRRFTLPAPLVFAVLALFSVVTSGLVYVQGIGHGFSLAATLLLAVVLALNEWTTVFRTSLRRRRGLWRRHFTSLEIGVMVVLLAVGALVNIFAWAG